MVKLRANTEILSITLKESSNIYFERVNSSDSDGCDLRCNLQSVH